MRAASIWTGMVTLAAVLGLAVVAQGIDLEFIGDLGNGASSAMFTPCASGGGCTAGTPNALGDVGYRYGIGKTEVTNPEYIQFLNAVAADDIHGLYHGRMTSNPHGGIIRNGVSGTYTYSLKSAAFANKPATHIRFYQAVRFANWMQNGQPSGAQGPGTTETGTYDIAGTGDIINNLIQRSAGAVWALPNPDEYAKAGFYSPGAGGSSGADYYDYATSSNTAPGTVEVDANGDVTNSATANIANLFCGVSGPCNWNTTTTGNVTNVGGPGVLSESPYGLANAQSNVSEWIESISTIDASHRVKTKNSWGSGSAQTLSNFFGTSGNLTSGSNPREDEGFRLVAIPEPATLALLGIGGLMVLRRRR